MPQNASRLPGRHFLQNVPIMEATTHPALGPRASRKNCPKERSDDDVLRDVRSHGPSASAAGGGAIKQRLVARRPRGLRRSLPR